VPGTPCRMNDGGTIRPTAFGRNPRLRDPASICLSARRRKVVRPPLTAGNCGRFRPSAACVIRDPMTRTARGDQEKKKSSFPPDGQRNAPAMIDVAPNMFDLPPAR